MQSINKEVNMNKEVIFLTQFLYGKTELVVRIGRNKYNLVVNKNSISADIALYPITQTSKYGNNTAFVHNIKNNAMIDKEFLAHAADIEKAQKIIRDYGDSLLK